MEINELIKNNQLALYVKPNAKKTEITGKNMEKQCVNISVKAPPEDNKANIEIIKFFTKLLKRKIKITKGLKSKTKIISIE